MPRVCPSPYPTLSAPSSVPKAAFSHFLVWALEGEKLSFLASASCWRWGLPPSWSPGAQGGVCPCPEQEGVVIASLYSRWATGLLMGCVPLAGCSAFLRSHW